MEKVLPMGYGWDDVFGCVLVLVLVIVIGMVIFMVMVMVVAMMVMVNAVLYIRGLTTNHVSPRPRNSVTSLDHVTPPLNVTVPQVPCHHRGCEQNYSRSFAPWD